MKLIFSQNFDPSTDTVIEWLTKFNKPFIRLNYNTDSIDAVFLELVDEPINVDYSFEDPKYDVNNFVKTFTIKLRSNVTIDLKQITGVWYRKGGMPNYSDFLLDFSILKAEFFIAQAKQYVKGEYGDLVRYIYFFLFNNPKINTIGNPGATGSNKLTYLTLAKIYGLRIPELFVVSRKDEMQYVFSKIAHRITKGVSEMVSFTKDYLKLICYTSDVGTEDLDKVEDIFFPSAIQRKIIKLADIRVVFFNGEFFSMAIFSQNNPQTMTDFRVYDASNPNRNTPFKLPLILEDKLRNLCKRLRLNFCSIDILLDRDYEYYFLEVNPVGQFGMVSVPCNYYIEKKLAEYL